MFVSKQICYSDSFINVVLIIVSAKTTFGEVSMVHNPRLIEHTQSWYSTNRSMKYIFV